MNPVIKQIIPIPEGLAAMTRHEDKNGRKYYYDANANGETVVYALVEDESGDGLEFYAADCYGCGELEEYETDYVLLTPTVHCQKCGRRMLANTTTKAPGRVIYSCICGEAISDDIFDKIRESCENPEG